MMVQVLETNMIGHNWKRLLKKQYGPFLRKAVRWRGLSRFDATSWVNLTDTMNDMILFSLFTLDATIGTYTLGNIGSVLTPSPGNRFATTYPNLFKAVTAIHDKRKESDLFHPMNQSTKMATRPIRFKELPKLRVLLSTGYAEMFRVLGI
jgi:hypothetical protein